MRKKLIYPFTYQEVYFWHQLIVSFMLRIVHLLKRHEIQQKAYII